MYRANKPKESGHRITPTLIAIIVLFTLLVAPADLVNFARLTTDQLNYDVFEAANVITNFLLTINFAVNFVLYCVVSAQFRKTARDVLCCRWRRGRGGDGGEGSAGDGRQAMALAGTHTYTCNVSETEVVQTMGGSQKRGSDHCSEIL